MMQKKHLHNVKITVFTHYHEGVEQTKQKLKEFFPHIDFDDQKEQITIQESDIQQENEEEDEMAILTIYTKKQKHVKDFLVNLNNYLTKKDKATLLEQATSRLDHKNRFYIRLDKQQFIKNNKYILTQKGDCFHIKMNIACFPNTKEKAEIILRDIFGTR